MATILGGIAQAAGLAERQGKGCELPGTRTLAMPSTEESILRPTRRAEAGQSDPYWDGARGKNKKVFKQSHYLIENKGRIDEMPEKRWTFLHNCRTFLDNAGEFCRKVRPSGGNLPPQIRVVVAHALPPHRAPSA